MGPSLQNGGLEMRVAIRSRIDIEHRREAPALGAHIEKAVVLEVVVFVRHQDGEDQPAVQLVEVGHRIGAMAADEIDDLRISVAPAVGC